MAASTLVSRVRLIWARRLGTTKSFSWESFLSCRGTASSSICPRTASTPNEGLVKLLQLHGHLLVSEVRTAFPRRIGDVGQFNKCTSSRWIKYAQAPIHPQLLHTDACEKALIPTAAAIPWQGWLDTSLATTSDSTLSDWIRVECRRR